MSIDFSTVDARSSHLKFQVRVVRSPELRNYDFRVQRERPITILPSGRRLVCEPRPSRLQPWQAALRQGATVAFSLSPCRYARRDVLPLGKFTLNLSGCPSTAAPAYTDQLYRVLQQLVPCVSQHWFVRWLGSPSVWPSATWLPVFLCVFIQLLKWLLQTLQTIVGSSY